MKVEYDKTSPVGVTTLMHMGSLDDVIGLNESRLKNVVLAGLGGYLASRLLGVGPPKLIGLVLAGYFLTK